MPRPSADRSAVIKAALAIYAVLIGSIMAGFLFRYPIPEFLAKLASVLSALWYVYALHALGRLLRSAAEPYVGGTADLGDWGNRLTNAITGFGVLGFVVIVLGWAVPGDLHLKLRLVFGCLVAVSATDFFLRRQSGKIISWPKWEAPMILAALPAAGCLASFLTSFTPITHYDSLVYHLALPAIYLRDGVIGAVPYNLYSFFPAATEMNFLFILGSLPAPEYTINLAGWILALGLGAAVAEWAASIGGKEQGWVATFLWWTAPLVLLLSQGAYVDLPLAAATFVAVRWWVAGRADDRGAILWSGLACGLAFSIKYTGALTFIILAVDAAFLVARRKLKWKKLAILVGAAAIFPLPWLLKNLFTIGNPVFPFLYRSVGGSVGWTAATADGYFRVLTEYSGRSNVLIDLVSGFWHPAGSGAARGGFDVLGDFGWPVILFGAPLAVVLRSDRDDIKFLSAYALAHFIGWYASKPVLRFLIGVFPVGVVLASTAIQSLFSRGRQTKVVTAILFAPWIVSNIFMFGLVAGELRLFSVPFGRFERTEFLRQRLAFYPTFEALNAGLPPGERVLVIGEQRTYHLAVPFVSSNLFAPSPIADFCNGAPETAKVAEQLRGMSVSTIVMNEAEIQRLGGLKRFGFTEEGENALRRFLADSTTVISQDRGVYLHRINPI